MTYNPYAPPAAEPPPPPRVARLDAPRQPWEIGEALSEAVKLFNEHGRLLVSAVFLFGLTLTPFGLVRIYITQAHVFASGPISVAVGVTLASLELCTRAFFTPGLLRILLATARGEPTSLGVLARGGDRFPSMAVVIFGTLSANLVDPVLSGLGVPHRTQLSLALIYGQQFIVYLGFQFAEYYVVDQGLGPRAAFGAAWRATRGQHAKALLFSIAAAFVFVLGILACGVGALATGAIATIASTVVYLRISGGGASSLATSAALATPHSAASIE